MTKIPDTLRETLLGDALDALDQVFAPPPENRVSGSFEVEIEMKGEGTFSLHFEDGALSARKGFAEEDPFLSCEISRGSWPLLQNWLQNGVEGFPNAPSLQRHQVALRALDKKQQEALVRGIEKLDDVAVEIDIPQAAKLRVARGALDEVTRQLTLQVPKSVVEALLQGAGDDALQGIRVSGNRGISTELMSALGPILRALRAS
jgi:hypothetical protein